jgi:hypothetical protein
MSASMLRFSRTSTVVAPGVEDVLHPRLVAVGPVAVLDEDPQDRIGDGAFDGGGVLPVLEETNDIGFQAVEVMEGAGIEPGIWMRLLRLVRSPFSMKTRRIASATALHSFGLKTTPVSRGSTSPSTAAACCRCWRRPTTSASRRSR